MKKTHQASQDDPFLLHTLFDHDQTQLSGRKRPQNHFHDTTHLVYREGTKLNQASKPIERSDFVGNAKEFNTWVMDLFCWKGGGVICITFGFCFTYWCYQLQQQKSPTFSLCYIYLFSGCWNIDYNLVRRLTTFTVGRLLRTKTFWTNCVNRFQHICA